MMAYEDRYKEFEQYLISVSGRTCAKPADGYWSSEC